jgi:hypothetical protein
MSAASQEDIRSPQWLLDFQRDLSTLPVDGEPRWNCYLKWADRICGWLRAGKIDRKADCVTAFRTVAINQWSEKFADGPEVQKVLARITEAANPKPRFRVRRFGEVPFSRKNTDRIKGLLPERGIVTVWGAPKCGKSFWVSDAVLHLAMGWESRGRRVRQCAVLYFVLEGRNGWSKREEAMRHHYQLSNQDVPFLTMQDNIDLINDRKALIADLRQQFSNGHQMPGVIVIDTVNRALVGSESSDQDMGNFLAAVSAIEQAFECLVILVHHCGINETRMRGHTSMRGNIDVQIEVKLISKERKIFQVSVVEAKDMAEGEAIQCQLQAVEIGTDEDDGEKMYSMIVAPVEAEIPIEADAPANKGPQRQEKETKGVKILRAAFMAISADVGQSKRPWADGPIVRAVKLEILKAEFTRRYPATGTEKQKQDAIRKTWNNSIARAVADNVMVTRALSDGDWVWLATGGPRTYAGRGATYAPPPERCPICGEAKSGCSSCNAEMRAEARGGSG